MSGPFLLAGTLAVADRHDGFCAILFQQQAGEIEPALPKPAPLHGCFNLHVQPGFASRMTNSNLGPRAVLTRIPLNRQC